MATSGDSAPRFTIAKFVRELGDEAGSIFTQVLLACDRLGLISAIDGVKLPSNAAKRRSGTHAGLTHEAQRMDKAVAKMLAAHRRRDASQEPAEDDARERERIERLRTEAAIDSERGRKLNGRWIATVEPLFANLRHNRQAGPLHATNQTGGE
jgi:hypothetical protein